ncbi:CGNR zinc finger domain-containing protein [Streptomyces sp. NPDC058953]|uniref:CGNR zinc finger domain-containing protein n=1 Tax=unclassified Streptomyces TaxID=2593676 RepID=UPI00367FC1AF
MNERQAAPGGLALIEALVNTLDLESGADALDTPDGRAPFGLTPDDVPAARELREALRSALLAHAGHTVPGGPRPAELGRLLAGAPLAVTVTDDGAATLTPAPGAAPALAARVAAAIAASLTTGTWLRLKCCEAETCRWAYYDRSPAARGRWCSMSVCGARAKMRAYRARSGPRRAPRDPC